MNPIIHKAIKTVTGEARARARIKYELNGLRHTLYRYLASSQSFKTHYTHIMSLCAALVHKYTEYLHCLDKNIRISPPRVEALLCYPEYFQALKEQEAKLTRTLSLSTRIHLLRDIITRYQQFVPSLELEQQTVERSTHLMQLFQCASPQLWLSGLVDFWNNYEFNEFAVLFHHWNVMQQQEAIYFFTAPAFIQLANAIFFYKLHPEELFAQIAPPEKLISIRMRLTVLHGFIESMQRELQGIARKSGLTPVIDYLLHGDELPQGTEIKVKDEFRECIQGAIKKLKIAGSPHYQQNNRDLLNDLSRAYKFWFNPNRLIDAVMVLQQNLVAKQHSKKELFQQEMVLLFGQLPTTECLDLYGYFANNDSRYLLYTFYAAMQGISFDWLGLLKEQQKIVVENIFSALLQVMEALRIELQNRGIQTEPFQYDMAKENIHIGYRNQTALLRAIAIYDHQESSCPKRIEQLFGLIEEF